MKKIIVEDPNLSDESYLQALYYFKIIYYKCWDILNEVRYHYSHHLTNRFNQYYISFLEYLRPISMLENFIEFDELIDNMPNDLSRESLDIWDAKKLNVEHEFNKGKKRIEETFKYHGSREYAKPQWLEESFSMIDSWIQYTNYPDTPIFIDTLSTLEEKIKNITNKFGTKIVIEKDGTTNYISLGGKVYEGIIGTNTNTYKLLLYLSSNVGVIFPVEDLAKQLNTPRSDGQESTPDRRVTDTIKTFRDLLGLKSGDPDDIFLVNNGYGLRYPVIFNS